MHVPADNTAKQTFPSTPQNAYCFIRRWKRASGDTKSTL